MTSEHVVVDTTVLAHAMGGPSPQRTACRGLAARASSGELVRHASTEAVQEFLFHRLRMGERAAAVDSARLVMRLCLLHDLDREVLSRAIDLASTTMLRGRDAVHAATALRHSFDTIVSADRDLDRVPGLRRVDPTGSLPREPDHRNSERSTPAPVRQRGGWSPVLGAALGRHTAPVCLMVGLLLTNRVLGAFREGSRPRPHA